MGGGNKPKEGAAADAATGTLQTEVLCEYERIPPGTKQDCALMVRVKAAPPLNERAPVTICAAIDRR